MPRRPGPAPWVGVLQLELRTEAARSLKEKRALLLPLLTRWRARPELSVARLADHDRHDRETWVLACVAGDRSQARAALERAREDVAAAGLAVGAARLDVEDWEPLDARDVLDADAEPIAAHDGHEPAG